MIIVQADVELLCCHLCVSVVIRDRTYRVYSAISQPCKLCRLEKIPRTDEYKAFLQTFDRKLARETLNPNALMQTLPFTPNLTICGPDNRASRVALKSGWTSWLQQSLGWADRVVLPGINSPSSMGTPHQG